MNGQCHGQRKPAIRSTYRVFVEQQLVIYWSPDQQMTPFRLQQCVVRDLNNWTCKYPDGTDTLSMIDGWFSIQYPPGETNPIANWTYVHGWQWWKLRLRK